ncbi:phosphatase PAP2 family protein [Tenacibaculum dicentrarchi]|uniref:phosphatase PAP2 family protein n=1 Tax=Tenacibaculum dicentrarchi TaxID=669041 RepID=UPI000C7B021E|nr:conserved membrane hypothetical protein [Tenacibaculum dicentrarchi]
MKSKITLFFREKLNKNQLNNKVIDSYVNVKYHFLIPPFFLLLLCFFYFIIFNNGGNFVDEYVNIQKDLFFYLNNILSKLPSLQFNLTQLGDVLISFPLITIFIIYAPKIWEALLTSAIISLIVSAVLKKIFAVPRPAAMLDTDNFVIIGKTLTGHTSLPSGHSIATFVVITTLLFAFMPQKNKHKIIWSFSIITLGLIIAFSRVGVGAHYPLDVIIGSILGYIVTIIGIKLNTKINWFCWIKNKKYLPIFMISLTIWSGLIIQKILKTDLIIFYLSLLSLIVSLYLISKTYVQRKN